MKTMRPILFVLVWCLLVVPLPAQEATPQPDTPDTAQVDSQTVDETRVLRVFADSVFIRALPTRDSEPVGSAFENDSLVAVGRNVDGGWFEVRRPGRDVSAGWISREWVAFGFDIAELPITDLTTGVTGPEPVFDSGFAVSILTEAALRDRPSINGERIGVIPVLLTIPAYERSPDNLWVQVNYLGTVGWLAEFLIRSSAPIAELPISEAFALASVPVEIIPVEAQLAQLNRLREYIIPKRDLIDSVANFWAVLQTGEVVPCNPPAGGYGYYPVTSRDVVELPELRRYTRRLNLAIDDMNAALATMQRCGVYTEGELSTAYAKAINARLIFNATLDSLDVLETDVILRNP